jgi:hypothetical protein
MVWWDAVDLGARRATWGLLRHSWLFWFVMTLFALMTVSMFVVSIELGAAVAVALLAVVVLLLMPSISVDRDVLRVRGRLKRIEFARSDIASFEGADDVEAFSYIALDMASGPRHQNLVVLTRDGARHSVRCIVSNAATISRLVAGLERWRRGARSEVRGG